MLGDFFTKYPMPYTDGDALRLIYDSVCFAQKLYTDDSIGTSYLVQLAGVDTMIRDFFVAKNVDINNPAVLVG